VKIGEVWVVTRGLDGCAPTLADVLFRADVGQLLFAALGGLRGEDVVGVWTSREEALPWALAELAATTPGE
jgi:hypothetical protein